MQQKVIDLLSGQPSFTKLAEELRSGKSPGRLGLARASRVPVLSALQALLNRPILVIADKTDRALLLEDEWNFWSAGTRLSVFSEPDPLFYEEVPWSRKTRHERLRLLAELSDLMLPDAQEGGIPPLILAPVRGLMTRTLPRRSFLKASRTIRVGSSHNLQALAAEWVRSGYQPAPIVTLPGEFARRGGILDLWPPGDRFPARLEFFGDEIEMLRRFDPENQRTIEQVEQIRITPAREFLLPETTSGDLEPGELSEYHIPLLHLEKSSLLNYLPADTVVFIDDGDAVKEAALEIGAQAESLRKGYQRDGQIEADFPLPYLPWEELKGALAKFQIVTLGPAGEPSGEGISAHFTPNQPFGGELKSFTSHVAGIIQRGEEVAIVSRQSARLEEVWSERTQIGQSPRFVKGSIEGGWIFTGQDGSLYHLFSDSEIFGWRRIQPRRRPVRRAQSPEINYTDFKLGDWVVHIDHGIGRFAGLTFRELDGIEGEYLAVEYAEEDTLYVPASQADRLTRYVGPDHHDPVINRLGGERWNKAKTRVKEEVIEVAQELLALYARRQTVTGYAFSPDTAWQQELEASFPYIETEDQLQVLSQVKIDMEKPRPMDRLICGDVGYGKTEIALRAAFKAVQDGKQVAVLVPTTVLAQQHYDTFLRRMSGFPVEVRMLSRFRTPRQQRMILSGLIKGTVDIVIGTHRLLSRDVIFKDLGLLIVDEEQRFGVAHKEKIKAKRADIDVLTLTATPIPRTMYMALTGVRDISRINTPPEERLPVITHVGTYDPGLVQRAIWRELERGGQVFFVHNRVMTIQAVRSHLANLVPEARIGIAHGQMAEKDLAGRMREFTRGEIDVLLSTSIIESGLDIPNANTLIVDRADRFGLAQLYQLRGRVGRGAQRAYAYFFKERQGRSTLEGRLRLETIAEHTDLGAGYSIAMRDLEIRGSGDILGTRQSGYIAAVGFHLYTRLLADAVNRMKTDQGGPESSQELSIQILRPLVKIDLPLPVGIPEDYIQDQSVRLSLYRRAASISQLAEIDQLESEFKDRFGPLPAILENLLQQLELKLLAEQAGVESIFIQYGKLALGYPEGKALPQPWEFDMKVKFGESTVWLPFDTGQEGWLGDLKAVLKGLVMY
ncbi:MAG TPA: transcription-repair coupling factor [Chloroflexi bacterium]|nr:transcription-repair coupling factor [Chloroflexota bacterium]